MVKLSESALYASEKEREGEIKNKHNTKIKEKKKSTSEFLYLDMPT